MSNTQSNEDRLIPIEVEEKIRGEIKQFEEITEIIIRNDEENEAAAEEIRKISKAVSFIENERMKLTKPLNDRKNKIIELVRVNYQLGLENKKQKLSAAISKYHDKKQAEIRERNRLIALEEERKRKEAEERAEKELKKAEQYREQGKDHLAEKAEIRASETITKVEESVPVFVEEKKVAGISFREYFVAEFQNKGDIIKFFNATCKNEFLQDCIIFKGGKDFRIDFGPIEKRKKNNPEYEVPGITFIRKKTTVTR